MAKSRRKTRSDKYPLTLHKTGQYCKKIKGKLYYFGTDKRQALERYLEQAFFLHSGEQSKVKASGDRLSVKMLCNLYLDHQDSRASIGEIQHQHVSDQVFRLKQFVQFVGPHRSVSDVSTIDLQNYRKKLIQASKSPNTVNNHIAVVKAMYNWAIDNEMIDHSPKLKVVKKITLHKREKLIGNLISFDRSDYINGGDSNSRGK